jgi:hypothetical protein
LAQGLGDRAEHRLFPFRTVRYRRAGSFRQVTGQPPVPRIWGMRGHVAILVPDSRSLTILRQLF